MCIVCEVERSQRPMKIKRDFLDISYCKKVTEIQISEDLQVLLCGYCTNLTSLGPLPEGLQELYCDGCISLTSLGPLPEGLQKLFCYDCIKLTSLGLLPKSLQDLYCGGCTNLTSLGPLPEGLQTLYCDGCTNLTSLGPLPEGLQILNCSGCTSLKSLGPLPEGLEYLDCDGCRVLTRVGPQSVIDNLDDYQPSTWTPSEELEENLKKLVLVQRFCRSLRVRKLLRLSRTKEFCEWFYHPENYGGRWAKMSLRKMINL